MSSKVHIRAYCLEWHLRKSDAFQELLVNPLKLYADVELLAWDGVSWPSNRLDDHPVIFCQLPPPVKLLEDLRARLIWLPMWDHAKLYSQEWWNVLPKSLRVVAFSNAVAQKAQTAGLQTLHLRYFKDPNLFEPAQWDNGRVLMYWNRKGLVGPALLKKLCEALDVQTLLFRGETDPGISARNAYCLPSRLGKTIVREFPEFTSRDEYLSLLRQANIFIAPRVYEGVGMTFLEALAQGCAVFGYNAPTMNEYITHGQDGYLFQAIYPSIKNKVLSQIDRFVKQKLQKMGKGQRFSNRYSVTKYQDWRGISKLDLKRLGWIARQHHKAGFDAWKKSIPEYARFVLEW